MIENVIYEMIKYFNKDLKRINHAMKVLGFARVISELEKIPSDSKFIVELAAILHDIGIIEAEKKYNSTAGKYQEIEGPLIAKEILLKCGLDNGVIERVCFIIGNHHSYNKIDGIDFQIIVEADLLVNIFEDNFNSKSIKAIEKYFKTSGGHNLLDIMY